jgi:hypothetical protein
MATLGELSVARNDVNVKIDSEVIKDAKMVAAARDITMAEYLSELLRPLVQRDLDQVFEERRKRAAEKKKPKGSDT